MTCASSAEARLTLTSDCEDLNTRVDSVTRDVSPRFDHESSIHFDIKLLKESNLQQLAIAYFGAQASVPEAH